MRKIHVDGILVLPTSSEILRKLLACRNNRTPCVILNRYYDVGVDCITNDDHYGGYTMMRSPHPKGPPEDLRGPAQLPAFYLQGAL